MRLTGQTAKKVAEILTELRDLKELVSKQRHRYIAYSNIITAIKKGREFEPTKHMLVKINEIIKTGRLQELEELKQKNIGLLSNYKFLKSIPGIGDSKAKKIFEDYADRIRRDNYSITLNDILNHPSLSTKQKQIVRLMDRISPTISRNEASKVYKELKSSVLSETESYAVGSLRRKKSILHDLDILIYTSESDNLAFRELCKATSRLDKCEIVVSSGPRSFTFLYRYKNNKLMQIDYKYFFGNELIAALVYFTGPQNFNIMMRSIAKKKGYKLSQYGLFDRQTNKPIILKSEKDLFDVLGMDYIEPSERQ